MRNCTCYTVGHKPMQFKFNSCVDRLVLVELKTCFLRFSWILVTSKIERSIVFYSLTPNLSVLESFLVFFPCVVKTEGVRRRCRHLPLEVDFFRVRVAVVCATREKSIFSAKAFCFNFLTRRSIFRILVVSTNLLLSFSGGNFSLASFVLSEKEGESVLK